jgi:predicted  nucleic acid-binding Zn-ribbon protein
MAQEICSVCGIAFSLPDTMQAELRKKHKTFYCPNGHGQYYPQKSDLEIANEKIAQLERTLKARTDALEERGERILALERQRAALRAIVTRFKNQRRKNNGR